MGKATTEASWIGKASYELGILTGQNGTWCHRKAKAFAADLQWQGVPLATHDPRSTMRWLQSANDNATPRTRTEPPTTFGDVRLNDIDVDVSGAPRGFTFLVIDSDQQALDRPTRVTAPHALAQGLRDALAGETWSVHGRALVHPYDDLIIVSLAKQPTKTLVTLILTRNEALGLCDMLDRSAGRPHWSRFTGRGFWHNDLPRRRAA